MPASSGSGSAGTPPAHGPGTWSLLSVALLAFLIGYLLSGMFSDRRSRWERQMMFEGMVRQYDRWKALRPGLAESLDGINADLNAAVARLDALSAEHVALAGDEAQAKRREWNDLRRHLQRSRRDLADLRDLYGLSPDETVVLRQLAQIEEQLIRQKRAELEAEREAKRAAEEAGGGESESGGGE